MTLYNCFGTGPLTDKLLALVEQKRSLGYKYPISIMAPFRYINEYFYRKGLGTNDFTEDVFVEFIEAYPKNSYMRYNIWVAYCQLTTYLKNEGQTNVYVPIDQRQKRKRDCPPYIFTASDKTKIFQYLDKLWAFSGDFRYKTFKMLITLYLYCGLRNDEARHLKRSDIEPDFKKLNLRYTKGDLERVVPLSKKVGDFLRQYCEKYYDPTNEYLFTINGRMVSKWQLQDFWSKCRNALNILTPNTKTQPHIHDMRHTYVHEIVEKALLEKVDEDELLAFLQLVLGHSCITTTEGYMIELNLHLKFVKSDFSLGDDIEDMTYDDIDEPVYDLDDLF